MEGNWFIYSSQILNWFSANGDSDIDISDIVHCFKYEGNIFIWFVDSVVTNMNEGTTGNTFCAIV